jgi:phenylacetic acid degradation operon negative regulatory protein
MLSIPQDRRAQRQKVYRSLRWAGFGSPTPGVWLTTHLHRRDHVADLVSKMQLGRSTLTFIGESAQVGLNDIDIVAEAWDLPDLARRYAKLVGRFCRRKPRPGTQMLRALLELDAELQLLPSLDPQLPTVLVPGWPGRDSAIRLLAQRQAWIGPAREHWFELSGGNHGSDP